MAFFMYKAWDAKGTLVAGELQGEDARAVKAELAKKGLIPREVSSKEIRLELPSILRRKKRVEPKELISVTRQFAALFKAGVAMDRILTVLARQVSHPRLKRALEEIQRDVSGGLPLSEAFSRHPHCFDELYVNMLMVGEQGGGLDKTLAQLADVLGKEHRVLASVKSATLYPRIVITVFILVFVGMMIFVVPRFSDFYSGYGAQLPFPTRIMIGVSDFFVHYGYIAVLLVLAGVIGFNQYISTSQGRLQWDRLRFKFPVFGRLHRMVANARFAHLVSALYRSGVPLSRALGVVGKAIGNKAYEKEVEEINLAVQKGVSLSIAMEGKKFFTPLLVESVAVGEQSGALDELLEPTAHFYDEEVSDMLNRMTTLIEPLLLVGIFFMVGLLALAIFLPMWNVTKLILPGG
jgi:type II secretory pathway component PulF